MRVIPPQEHKYGEYGVRLRSRKTVSTLCKAATHGSAAASGNPATITGDGRGDPGCASPPSSII
jgi:hypothetical protein